MEVGLFCLSVNVLCGCSQDKRGEIAFLIFGYLIEGFRSPGRNRQSDERHYFEIGDALCKVANTE